MNWYTARALMRCEVEKKPQPFEEAYILVCADSEREALEAAKRVCRANEQTYHNVYKQRVKWTLARVLDVKEVLSNDLGHGVQVYWKFLSPAEARRMLDTVGKHGRGRPRRSGSSNPVPRRKSGDFPDNQLPSPKRR